MKVSLEEHYRDRYTLSDLERAKRVIAYEKEDEETAKGWAVYICNEWYKNDYSGSCIEVLKAVAHTARNGRAWNLYDNESGDMDVWIDAVIETTKGFLKCGAYLSDIWQSGAVDFREHIYASEYTNKD